MKWFVLFLLGCFDELVKVQPCALLCLKSYIFLMDQRCVWVVLADMLDVIRCFFEPLIRRCCMFFHIARCLRAESHMIRFYADNVPLELFWERKGRRPGACLICFESIVRDLFGLWFPLPGLPDTIRFAKQSLLLCCVEAYIDK